MTLVGLEKQETDNLSKLDDKITKAKEELSRATSEEANLRMATTRQKEQQAAECTRLEQLATQLRTQEYELRTTACQQNEEAERLKRRKEEHDNQEVEISRIEGELTRRDESNNLAQAELAEALSSLQSLTLLLSPHDGLHSVCTAAKQIATAVNTKVSTLVGQVELKEEVNKSLQKTITEKMGNIQTLQADKEALQILHGEVKGSESLLSTEVARLDLDVKTLNLSFLLRWYAWIWT